MTDNPKKSEDKASEDTAAATDAGDDRVLRAMTDDGGFRVITVRTTETVRKAAETQEVRAGVAQLFGELLTGAVLYRETMAPKLRVQVIVQGAEKSGQLIADSMPDGATRGLVRVQDKDSLPDLGEGAVLQMMRTMPRGDVHKGVVAFPESQSISDAFMGYMQTSEQVVSMISLGCKMKDGEVESAGGYIVQLLPELNESDLAIMTERLKDFRSVDRLLDTVAATPEGLLSELLYGMDHTLLDSSNVSFGCTCSRVRVMASLATLARSELAELMAPGTPIEMSCDYCGTDYAITPQQLTGLLGKS